MSEKRLLRVVVASPSDVKAERDVLPTVVEELNKGIAGELGVYLELLRWETDAFPAFHSEGPQGLIDPILNIEDCDILIGIFWKRFGTPTKDSLSGTEHEFLVAYDAWKSRSRPQLMVYFNKKPADPKTKDELDQLGKVLDFKSRFPKEGLWWTYKGKTEFSTLVRKHLTSFLRQSKNKIVRDSTDDFSIFLHEYRRRLSGLYARWDLSPVGVAQSGGANKPIEAKLDEMYLPLRLSTGFDPSDVDKGSVYSPLALLARDKPVVIRGIAGSGKTTWMRWTFRVLLKDKDTFPMIVELRRLASSWMQGSTGGEQRSLDNYLQGWVSEYVSANWVSKLQGILTAESGPRPVLFVDGWDELGPLGEELRSKLVGFVATHPRVLVVVTSRPYGQGRPSHSDGFDVLDIQPLSDPEIKAFAENFYRKCYGEDERTAEEYVTRFLTALDRSPEATSLARTALLLTMMLLISRSSPLPDKRHLLYQKCVENLLTALPDRRQEEGALLSSEQWRPDDSEERLRTVARMAFRMQDYGYQDGRRAIILGWDDARTQLPESWREDQKDKFIRWLTGPAGLIVDRADGTIAFAHLSFQEFLAAWYLHTTIEGDEGRTEFCTARLNDVSWWETLRLWAALVAGQHPAKWRPVIERLLSEEVGLYLAGAMIADGLSSDDLLAQWMASFLEIVRRAWSYHMDATIQAWAASRQEDRKRIIAEKLNSVAPGTWLEWMRYREWARAVRLQVTLPLPAEGSNARAVIDGLYRKIETPEQIALGRILCSGSPLWPGEPSELVLLQVWPSRRRVIGHLLQSLVSLGATRAQLLRVAKHSFARVQQASPYYSAEEVGAPRISDFLYNFGGTWAVNVGSYELFEFDLGQDWKADWMTQCIFDSSTATVEDCAALWEHVLDYKYCGRLRSRDCADYWVRKIAQTTYPYHQPRFVVGTELDNLLNEFPGIQFLVLPRMAIRVLLSHFEPTRQPGGLALMALACRLSMQPRADSRPFKKAIRYYPRSEDPLWPALGRHISRRSTARDRKLLVALAQNPEKRQGHLSWGLKYIVRGDIRLDDQSVITLDDLAQELRLPTLPYLDELPPHLED